jgi:hypothetical protein
LSSVWSSELENAEILETTLCKKECWSGQVIIVSLGHNKNEMARVEMPEELSGQSLEIFVRFLYSNIENWCDWPSEPLPEAVLLELLWAGEKYGIPKLRERVAFGLIRNLNSENVDELIELFLHHKLKSVCQEAFIFKKRVSKGGGGGRGRLRKNVLIAYLYISSFDSL